MERLINNLFEERIETHDNIIRSVLKASDAKSAALIKEGSKIMNMIEKYDQEDTLQDVALGIIKYTQNHLENNKEESIENILKDLADTEYNIYAAAYWNYIKLRTTGDFKDRRRKHDTGDNYQDNNKNILFSSFLDEGQDSQEYLDKFLMSAATGIYDQQQQEHNHFIKWFLDNKENVLTKTQLEFYNRDHTEYDKNAAAQRERICKRVLKKYYEYYNAANIKEAEKQNKIDQINNIIDAEENLQVLKDNLDNDFIINILYTHSTSTDVLKYINHIYTSDKPDFKKSLYLQILNIFHNKISELEK